MTITEVSKKINISADALRYYEKIGLIPKIKRNKTGIRDYSGDDLSRGKKTFIRERKGQAN